MLDADVDIGRKSVTITYNVTVHEWEWFQPTRMMFSVLLFLSFTALVISHDVLTLTMLFMFLSISLAGIICWWFGCVLLIVCVLVMNCMSTLGKWKILIGWILVPIFIFTFIFLRFSQNACWLPNYIYTYLHKNNCYHFDMHVHHVCTCVLINPLYYYHTVSHWPVWE